MLSRSSTASRVVAQGWENRRSQYLIIFIYPCEITLDASRQSINFLWYTVEVRRVPCFQSSFQDISVEYLPQVLSIKLLIHIKDDGKRKREEGRKGGRQEGTKGGKEEGNYQKAARDRLCTYQCSALSPHGYSCAYSLDCRSPKRWKTTRWTTVYLCSKTDPINYQISPWRSGSGVTALHTLVFWENCDIRIT